MDYKHERAFSNALALSLLLLGLGFIALSIGGLLQFFVDLGYQRLNAESTTDWAYRGVTLLATLSYFACGVALFRTRPKYGRDKLTGAPNEFRHSWNPFGLASAVRALSFAVLFLGVLLLFANGTYARDTSLASVLLLSGAFGVVATFQWRRSDQNVRAVGAVLAAAAAGLLLFAQMTLPYVVSVPGDYGAWEIANLVIPTVLGPVAALIACIGALAYAYIRHERTSFLAFLLVGVGALVYGIGLTLVSLTAFLDTPWSTFTNTDTETLMRLLSLTAGIVLLALAGIATVAAALFGLVRNGVLFAGNKPKDIAPAPAWVQSSTTTEVVIRSPTIVDTGQPEPEKVVVDAPTVVPIAKERRTHRRRTTG